MVDASQPYNPLDRVELGKSVERALLSRPLEPLPPERKFSGAGLYAIYYSGPYEAYAPIAPPCREAGEVPIYVGRARPKGARQGVSEGLDVTTTDPVLYERLRQHARSIRQVEEYGEKMGQPTVRLSDFACRYLVADDIWVPLGEALLIGHYRPLWNVVVDGFGNHAPGKGRSAQARSPWDELHPGRGWAFRLPPPKASKHDILRHIEKHLSQLTLPDLAATPDLDNEVRGALEDQAES
jgi:hypothetical protein